MPMKLTEKYEAMLVFSVKGDEESIKTLVDKFTVLVGKYSETFEVEDWGKRKLAYAINDEPEGYYYLIKFEATPDFPAEFTRQLNITDGVLRSLITVSRAPLAGKKEN
ncbi:MAG: 30S ribosomal protein S6 [Ruminococcus sp.]|jgi:small subunit ribosomal protein S6|nr:30S ribosomal protein S6 [Ruminococcus sp.]